MTWTEIADAADARYHADVLFAALHTQEALADGATGAYRSALRQGLAAGVYAACARGERALATIARRMAEAGR